MSSTIFSITSGEQPFTLRVMLAAASEIRFTFNFQGMDYDKAIEAICHVAPHMQRLDGDLAEAYDNAFRTQPKRDDIMAVRAFLTTHAARLPELERLKVAFGSKGS